MFNFSFKALLLSAFIALSPYSVQASGVMVFGDSLSAGYGLEPGQGWVDLLAQRVQEEGLAFEVVNASVSGETTSGGLARLPDLLDLHEPQWVVLELGANDGLRGMPLQIIEANLAKLAETVQASGAQLVVVGIRLPPNYGPRYTDNFFNLFPKLAETFEAPLVPFLLEGVADNWSLMQADGLHPTAEAQPKILGTVWQVLADVIR
ncbi:arylesterase [Marinobacterium sp. LSUCC0821]|uniref:arylesterase n=1 Tax=Marinobacterium sp. LSUCC0821 TaxID=2668067 RepID=UPI0014517553|nr:arylesterase [Marinobacterium sp. LSUCC0821]QJD71649.1 arylesterase [Marinobacterium sp. LSUCC0821]